MILAVLLTLPQWLDCSFGLDAEALHARCLLCCLSPDLRELMLWTANGAGSSGMGQRLTLSRSPAPPLAGPHIVACMFPCPAVVIIIAGRGEVLPPTRSGSGGRLCEGQRLHHWGQRPRLQASCRHQYNRSGQLLHECLQRGTVRTAGVAATLGAAGLF